MSSNQNETAPASMRVRPREVLIASSRRELLDKIRRAAAASRDERPDRVDVFDSGAEALDAIATGAFDALVLDGELDDVTAPTLFERARARNRDARAVVFTDRFDDMLERSMLGVGFVACVSLAEAYKVGFFDRALSAMTVGGDRRARTSSDGDAIVAMLLAMREPALLVDHFGRIRVGNRAFSEATSLGRSSATGREVSDFFPEIDVHDLAARVTEDPVPLQLRRASGNVETVVPRFVAIDHGGENLVGILF